MMEKTLKGLNLLIGLALVAFLTVTVTTNKLLDYKNRAKDPEFVSAKTIEKRLNCLAMNIYKEAGHEPFEGKVAVAQVTLNRVESGRFGKDVCGVVYQKNVIYEKVVCQFSWVCMPGVFNRPVYSVLYKESEEVAKKVLLENFRLPSMRDAMYYHATYVNPKWGKPKIAQIGNHIFYKD